MDSVQRQCLTSESTRVKVSSTLPGNKAEYGKQNLLDGNNETSWYSNQGKFQYICVFFEKSVCVEEIDITFCGGFSPKVRDVYLYCICIYMYMCRKWKLGIQKMMNSKIKLQK